MDDSRLCRAVVTMSKPDGLASRKDPAPPRALSGLLRYIPLKARIVFYAVFFLCLLLIALPWLAYHLDLYLPQWHFEVGWPVRCLGLALFLASLVAYLWSSTCSPVVDAGPMWSSTHPRNSSRPDRIVGFAIPWPAARS